MRVVILVLHVVIDRAHSNRNLRQPVELDDAVPATHPVAAGLR